MITKSCLKVRDIAFKTLGWTIRYLMVMRDNYFGSFTNFSTLYEYLDKRKQGLPVGDPLELKYRMGKARSFIFRATLQLTPFDRLICFKLKSASPSKTDK
jgi:hypothetical protein